MKRALVFVAGISFYACTTHRELEADMVNAELVKIDTIYRYPDSKAKVLTWHCKGSGADYYNIAPFETGYTIGSTIRVLVRK